MRTTHKLRALPGSKEEFILCTGKVDHREQSRYFWENVRCPRCLALRNAKVPAKKSCKGK